MKVTLDEHGIAMPDALVEQYVKAKVEANEDVHTSQELVLLCIRAAVFLIPEKERPQITWEIYGKEVFFDKHLRSNDAWQDPRTGISENALCILITS